METAFRNTLVRDLFADECEVIGAENVDAILSGSYKPVQTQYGENLAVVEFVGIVVSAVGFIDASISVYERFKKANPEMTAEAFVTRARQELRIPEEIDDDRVVAVFRSVTLGPS